jgi:hypothetical protein
MDSIAEKAKPSTGPAVPPPAATAAHPENASANSAPPVSKPVTPGVEDAARSIARQDWADLAASIQPNPLDTAAVKAKSLPSVPPQPPVVKRPETTPANSAALISKPPTQNIGDTDRSMPKQELDDFAAGLQHKPIEQGAEKQNPSPVAPPPASTAKHAESAPMNSVPPAGKSGKQSPEDTARSIPKHDWADLAASVPSKTGEPVVVKPKPAATPQGQVSPGSSAISQPAGASNASAAVAGNSQTEPANSATPGSPDPALVEAVVQRVLEKMRPQVVDIITKEFLRPVVQALVHREITKR